MPVPKFVCELACAFDFASFMVGGGLWDTIGIV
jgi:hypothetical protein